MDIALQMNALAMLGARWVLWLLVGLSVVGLAVVVERAIQFVASRDDVQRLRDDLLGMLDRGEVKSALHRLQESPCFEAKIAAAGLSSDGATAARERMAGATELAKLDMEKHLAYLGTVGNNAPFVGLLGTVIGIIRAFHELNSTVGKVSAGLMAEIGEALVATAIGLLVALPAVLFFNLFQRMIQARLGRADALGREVLAHWHARESTSIAGSPRSA